MLQRRPTREAGSRGERGHHGKQHHPPPPADRCQPRHPTKPEPDRQSINGRSVRCVTHHSVRRRPVCPEKRVSNGGGALYLVRLNEATASQRSTQPALARNDFESRLGESNLDLRITRTISRSGWAL